mgnify:CR=1 FL=1
MGEDEVGWALRTAGEMEMDRIDRSLDLLSRADGKEKKFAFVGMDGKFVWASGECAICILAMAKLARLTKGHQLVTNRYKVVRGKLLLGIVVG